MVPFGKITPQDWMTAPETVAVFDAIRAEGGDVRFVGGCVRDAILKRPVKDIDIATPLPPDTVMAALEKAGIHAIPTGIDHGTVTAVINGKHFEITTLRVDVENYGRRAKVSFTDSWAEDAARRDFTINTLSSTLEGDVYDYFGGLNDLGNGIVRFVGIASDRLDEDVLRLLRFFRFHAAYGRPPADPDALAACRIAAPRLTSLSGERVRNELLQILLGPNPADTIQLMRGETVLGIVLPEANDVGRLRLMAWLETDAIKVEGVSPDWVRRLSTLFAADVDGAQATKVAERLRLSNNQMRQLAKVTEPGFTLSPEITRTDLNHFLYVHGADTVRDVALATWATELALSPRQPRAHTEAWIALLEHTNTWTRPVFPLSGRHVLDLGVAPGPDVGKFLRQVEAWWEQEGYQPKHDACINKLISFIGG